jgi:hypothetical protein
MSVTVGISVSDGSPLVPDPGSLGFRCAGTLGFQSPPNWPVPYSGPCFLQEETEETERVSFSFIHLSVSE